MRSTRIQVIRSVTQVELQSILDKFSEILVRYPSAIEVKTKFHAEGRLYGFFVQTGDNGSGVHLTIDLEEER